MTEIYTTFRNVSAIFDWLLVRKSEIIEAMLNNSKLRTFTVLSPIYKEQ